MLEYIIFGIIGIAIGLLLQFTHYRIENAG